MGDTTKNQVGHIMMADGVKFKPTEVLGDIRVIEVENQKKHLEFNIVSQTITGADIGAEQIENRYL